MIFLFFTAEYSEGVDNKIVHNSQEGITCTCPNHLFHILFIVNGNIRNI